MKMWWRGSRWGGRRLTRKDNAMNETKISLDALDQPRAEDGALDAVAFTWWVEDTIWFPEDYQRRGAIEVVEAMIDSEI